LTTPLTTPWNQPSKMQWVLVAFLGLAAASQITEFSPEKEYTFHYTSSILSGIPELGRQHAGVKLATTVKAQKFPDNTIRIKFQDSKFRNYNDEVEKDMRFPRAPRMDVEEQQEVPAAIKEHLEMPFKVVTHEELVQKIQVEATEPEFITNIKKAAVSQLLAVSQSKLTHESEGRRQFVESLQRMEESIMGECDTHYTVERMPEYLAMEFEEREQIPMRELCQGKDYYEVIKAKDLKNCRERPMFLHVYGASSVSDGSLGSSAPFAAESSVTRSIICGTPDSFHLRVTSNQHKAIISPSGKFHQMERMKVTSTSIVSLHSVEDKRQEIPDVKAPKPRGSLMFEHPKESSFSALVSEKSMVPQIRSPQDLEEDWYKAQVVQPDIESRPVSLYPKQTPEEKMSRLLVIFKRIVEIAPMSPESSHSGEDVTGSALLISRALSNFGLQDIKSLWQQIDASLPENLKLAAYHSFLDIVSISGTNPAIKFIIDEVKSSKLVGENAAMIVSNAIRSAKTPTKQLLKELIDLLKHIAEQDNRNVISTVVLAVTRLIHKACIHETSSVMNFPAKTYGRFCDEKAPEITRDLIPFLAEKLFATRKTDVNQLITYINALGNLGHDGAAIHLLKVIDDGSFDSHPRSVAVYQLRRAASRNPALYRPIILQLIVNAAESDVVRMAAITILPHTWPTSVHLNELAIRTWWEPSNQVSAYITSTLRALANPELERYSKIYAVISESAREAIKLAKPTDAGIQTSHNIMISHFLDTLKAAVNMKLQYVFSEEDELPRNLFMKASVKSDTHKFNHMEVAAHMEGGQFLLNKLYETYARFMLSEDEKSRMDTQRDYIKNIVNVESRRMRKPEAHITVKSLGLQRIFSLDSRMVEELLEKIAIESIEALKMHKVHSYEFMKIIDMNGHNALIPTESGLPVIISHSTPLVVSGQAMADMELKDMRDMKAAVTIKPVVNYKQITQAGIFCPITKKFLSASVDASVHIALPLVTEVALKEGQLEVIIRTPEDQESQREKPVFDMRVKPYTTNYDIMSPSRVPISRSTDAKVIRSANPRMVKEIPLGEPLGLALRLKVETEQPFADIAEILRQLSHHSPLTLLTLPFPLQTVKDHSIQLMYNPTNSNTKDISLLLSAGHGRKQSSSSPVLMSESPVTDVKKYMELALNKMTDPSQAVALNIEARLRRDNRVVAKNMIAQITAAKNDENSLMKIIMLVKMPLADKAYIADIDATRMVKRPINRWDKEAMIAEDIRSVIDIKAKAGVENEQMHDLMLKLVVERSEEMKAHVKSSEAWRMCEADNAKGLRLSESCIRARTLASALDVIKADLSLPRPLSRHPYMITLATALKAYFLPHLSVEDSSYNSPSQTQDNYQIVTMIAPNGMSLSLDVAAEGRKTVLSNIRLISSMKYVLPIVMKESLSARVVKMLTKSRLPSRCSIEGNRVATFDKLIYDYTLNDCEHVIFRDCTESPKVMVSVKKTTSQHIVKAVIDGNKYEIEMIKGSRGARTNPGQVKVNGQVKQAAPRVQGEPIMFEDASNQIYLYEDGVYEIFSMRHGLTIRADSESAEVKAFHGRLRNLACGLCGDLNDEKTACVKSAQQCVMSSPRLAAYSYMVEDGQCAGIPAQEKAVFQEETKECVRKEVLPSQVLDIFRNRQLSVKRGQTPMKHMDMEHGQKICISMKQVQMCPITVTPAEIESIEMPFFCVARDQEGRSLQKLAQSGDKIIEAPRFPIAFTSIVQVPKRC